MKLSHDLVGVLISSQISLKVLQGLSATLSFFKLMYLYDLTINVSMTFVVLRIITTNETVEHTPRSGTIEKMIPKPDLTIGCRRLHIGYKIKHLILTMTRDQDGVKLETELWTFQASRRLMTIIIHEATTTCIRIHQRCDYVS